VINWYEEHGPRVVRIDAIGSLEEVEARALHVLGY